MDDAQMIHTIIIEARAWFAGPLYFLGGCMKKAIDYFTIAAAGDEIDKLVNKGITEGWQPLGGISVATFVRENRDSFDEIVIIYCQAMVKYEDQTS